MVDALSFAASALRTASTRQDVLANNVANLLTPGFRSQRVDASNLVPGGVQVAAIRTDPAPGTFEPADRPLDLAVNGSGYFEVETPSGPRFTRAGSFSIDARGDLVDAAGNRLAPGLTVPPGTSSIAVAGDGTVTAVLGNGTTQEVGRIELAGFANPGGLLREGGNLFSVTPASGQAVAGAGTIVSGFLEGSNVNLVDQIVGQIANRAFFMANLATIRTEKEILGDLLEIVG